MIPHIPSMVCHSQWFRNKGENSVAMPMCTISHVGSGHPPMTYLVLNCVHKEYKVPLIHCVVTHGIKLCQYKHMLSLVHTCIVAEYHVRVNELTITFLYEWQTLCRVFSSSFPDLGTKLGVTRRSGVLSHERKVVMQVASW